CRQRFPRWVTWGLWLQAEVMAMATDVAEFLGAALGLNLLFGVPLFAAGLITGVIAFGILALQSRGYRPFELAIAALLGLVLAGVINMAMLAVAAKLFHVPGLAGLDSIQAAHHEFGQLIGGGAALMFAVALLASGASASSVGTYAGQVVMAGFINIRIPLMVRRAVTMIPALVVLAIGVSPMSALVLSQVVLSFGIPFALVPLVLLTRRRDVMGPLVNRGVTTIVAGVVAALIIALNGFLLYDQLLR